jgi:single-stranded DNA-binding protein
LVYVNGRINVSEYVDKNNQKRTDFGIIANQVRNLSPKDTTETPDTSNEKALFS